MKPVRVTLTWSELEATTRDNIYMDIYVDEEDMPHPQLTFLGWMTDENRSEEYPFKVTKDGRLDFGSLSDDSERWGKTNVRSRRLRQNEYATFWVDNTEFVYRIAEIKDLSLV